MKLKLTLFALILASGCDMQPALAQTGTCGKGFTHSMNAKNDPACVVKGAPVKK